MLLICSAWDQENKYLEQKSKNILVKSLGVGFLAAATSLERILNENPNIKNIYFIGTAGSYNKNLAIEDLVQVTKAGLLNLGTVLDKAYVPQPYPQVSAKINPGLNVKLVDCLSAMEITKSIEYSQIIVEKHKRERELVENMELYGLATVANKHRIPWTALLGITNFTDVDGHQNWKDNHSKVSQKLCNLLNNF